MTRPRTETVLLGAALLGVAIFLGSFVIGLASDGGPAGTGAFTADSGAASAVNGPISARGRVEVLNAGGTEGAARRATERLRSGGFDVVYYGNASARMERSVVLARVDDDEEEVARAAARRLGIDSVAARPDSTLLLDATVLVGPDWPPADVAAAETGWWARLKRAWFR
jgi:hypothetical protein